MENKIPELKLTREIPIAVKPKLEHAILNFIDDSGVHGDPIGFFNQTIQSIANATTLKGGGDFWLALDEEGEIAAYALAHVVKDIDNRLTYTVNQGYVAPGYRDGKFTKENFPKIEAQAKKYFCSHITNVVCRNHEPFLRLMGDGWKKYATILIKDLEG